MDSPDPNHFHRLYGRRKSRILYRKEDFADYALMTGMTALILYLCYGPSHFITAIGLILCILMVAAFPLRHGFSLNVPLIARRPQEVLHIVLHKVQNIRPVMLFAFAVLLLENLLIYLTPGLPHHTQLMHEIALWAFYAHLAVITTFRTVILIDHLRKKNLVREVLLETPWAGHISKQRSIVTEILHAYITGLLTHIVMFAPWYLVLSYAQFSAVLVPVVLIANAIVWHFQVKTFNTFYYRDHWVGHHKELDFLYLHGPHHDGLPSALIAVSGAGALEGFIRQAIGVPTSFYNPVFAALFYTIEVGGDIINHQYIPGVLPSTRSARKFHERFQHSVHHMLRLEPYSIGLKDLEPPPPPGEKRKFSVIPPALADSISLDEQLTGFEWANPYHQKFLELFDKYQK